MSVHEKINIRSQFNSNFVRAIVPYSNAWTKILPMDKLKNLSHCDSVTRFKLLF